MPAYVIAFVDIRDRDRFANEYVPPIAATLQPFSGKVVAATDEAVTLEGTLPTGRTVILEFPDLDRARGWYTSAAYAPLIALRKTIATTSLALLPGIPSAP